MGRAIAKLCYQRYPARLPEGESGIAVGYVCNNMLWDYTRGPDDRWLPWSKALREVAGL